MISKGFKWLGGVSLLAAVLLPAGGCFSTHPGVRGNGIYASENRSDAVAPFDEISLDTSANVEITVDPTLASPVVVVNADENLLPIIRLEVRGSRLHIRSTASHSSRNGVLVEVVTPSLSGVYLRGSGKMYARGIASERLEGRISGSGQMTLAGQTRDAQLAVTGSGTIIAADLEAEVGHATISGSGNISLYAREEAKLKISGSGAIACHGKPARVEQDVAGSGFISVR